MRLIGLMVAALLWTVPAGAQTWKEYSYAESGFTIHFPADPKVQDGSYMTADGTAVKARIYSLEFEGTLYSVTVADFSQLKMSEDSAIEQAVKQLTAEGEVIVNIEHRVNSTYGRQLSIAGKDGSRSTVAVFYRQNKLYLTSGKILPTNPDKASGDGLRFQQTLGWM